MIYTPAFWAMAIANLCHTASFGVFYLLPLYILDQRGTQSEIGVIMGTFALASALCRPWVSEMIDQIGRKKSYSLGCILMVITPLLYQWVPSPLSSGFVITLILRVVHGVGLAICFTAIFTFIADILPQSRLNEGIGMFGISGLLGIAIGPFLGETALQHFGFPGLFICGSSLAAIALIIHLPLKESLPEGEQSKRVRFFSLLKRPKFRITALLALLFGFGLAATSSFVSPLAEERSLGLVSIYYFFYSGGAITVRLFGGRVADRIGERRGLPVSIALYIAGLLILPFTFSRSFLCVAGLLSGTGHGLLFPLLNSLAVRHEPAEIRGKATGIFTGGIDSGIFIGSLILGYIGDWFGLDYLFISAGITIACALILLLLYNRHASELSP